MTVWLDAHLSPGIARWLNETFDVTALPVRELGLRGSDDDQIFFAARKAADVVITKDIDFVILLERHGSPPKLIWLTCGNTSDASLRQILTAKFREALRLLVSGEDIVEIGSI
jgi:predicted nuclease of predicted toxin-antitoxin system